MRYFPSIAIACCVLGAPAAVGQDRPGSAQTRPPWGNSPWVRLCETPTKTGKDLFGRDIAAGVRTCLIHHEQLSSATGAVVVAAAVRQAGARQSFMVVMPTGVQLVPGARAYIYPADLWAKALKKERIQPADAPRIRTLNLRYVGCHAAGCVAEAEADLRLIAELKSSAGLVVSTLRSGRAIAYGISLGGFGMAYDGPPVDSAKFYAARSELLRRLRERQVPRSQPPPQRPKAQDI
jgi:invasion protein IalB